MIAHHSRQMQATIPHGSRCGREARRAGHGTGRWHVLSFKVLTHRASGSRRGKGIYCDVVCHLSVVVASRQLRGFSPQSFEVIPYPPSRSRADCPQASVLSVPALGGVAPQRAVPAAGRRAGNKAVCMSSTSTARFSLGDRPWPRHPRLDAIPRFPMSR
jgi:hypothetical protein